MWSTNDFCQIFPGKRLRSTKHPNYPHYLRVIWDLPTVLQFDQGQRSSLVFSFRQSHRVLRIDQNRKPPRLMFSHQSPRTEPKYIFGAVKNIQRVSQEIFFKRRSTLFYVNFSSTSQSGVRMNMVSGFVPFQGPQGFRVNLVENWQKNRKIGKKSKIGKKTKIGKKIEHFSKNRKFFQKSKISPKIKKLKHSIRNRKYGQKSKF